MEIPNFTGILLGQMRFVGSIIFSLLLLLSCNKKVESTSKLLGHGGCGLEASVSPVHSNTLDAANWAESMYGIDGVELDVQLSKDGTLWMFHDPKIEEEAKGEGCISSSSDDYIESIRYRKKNRPKIDRLSELPLNFKKEILLDIRTWDFCNEKIVDTVKLKSALNQFLIGRTNIGLICVSEAWLNFFRYFDKSIILECTSIQDYIDLNDKTGISGISMRMTDISHEQIKQIQSLGVSVYLFELRSPRTIRRALSSNADYLVVDDLKTAVQEKKL